MRVQIFHEDLEIVLDENEVTVRRRYSDGKFIELGRFMIR